MQGYFFLALSGTRHSIVTGSAPVFLKQCFSPAGMKITSPGANTRAGQDKRLVLPVVLVKGRVPGGRDLEVPHREVRRAGRVVDEPADLHALGRGRNVRSRDVAEVMLFHVPPPFVSTTRRAAVSFLISP